MTLTGEVGCVCCVRETGERVGERERGLEVRERGETGGEKGD